MPNSVNNTIYTCSTTKDRQRRPLQAACLQAIVRLSRFQICPRQGTPQLSFIRYSIFIDPIHADDQWSSLQGLRVADNCTCINGRSESTPTHCLTIYVRLSADDQWSSLQGLRVTGNCTCTNGRTLCAPTAFCSLITERNAEAAFPA